MREWVSRTSKWPPLWVGGFATGLDFAPEQAQRYVQDLESCQVLVVSNGHCYKGLSQTIDR